MDIQERVSAMKPLDKVIGAILVVVVLGIVGGGLYTALPYLIAFAENFILFCGSFCRGVPRNFPVLAYNVAEYLLRFP